MTIRTYSGTLTANATSVAYLVEGGADGHIEPITLVLGGSFNGASCALQVSMGNTSPFVWVAVSNSSIHGNAGAFTSTDVHNINLVPGMYFRLVNSDSGSPQAAITYTLRGDIRAA